MAHYALLDKTNTVVGVITGRDETEVVDGISDWESHYSAETSYRALRTSYNTYGGVHVTGGVPFRGNYAGVGFTYNETLDAFIPPKPYDSWVINEETYSWDPPIPYPEDDVAYDWDKDKKSWVAVE
jgi:hypothetical protein